MLLSKIVWNNSQNYFIISLELQIGILRIKIATTVLTVLQFHTTNELFPGY